MSDIGKCTHNYINLFLRLSIRCLSNQIVKLEVFFSSDYMFAMSPFLCFTRVCLFDMIVSL